MKYLYHYMMYICLDMFTRIDHIDPSTILYYIFISMYNIYITIFNPQYMDMLYLSTIYIYIS